MVSSESCLDQAGSYGGGCGACWNISIWNMPAAPTAPDSVTNGHKS